MWATHVPSFLDHSWGSEVLCPLSSLLGSRTALPVYYLELFHPRILLLSVSSPVWHYIDLHPLEFCLLGNSHLINDCVGNTKSARFTSGKLFVHLSPFYHKSDTLLLSLSTPFQEYTHTQSILSHREKQAAMAVFSKSHLNFKENTGKREGLFDIKRRTPNDEISCFSECFGFVCFGSVLVEGLSGVHMAPHTGRPADSAPLGAGPGKWTHCH